MTSAQEQQLSLGLRVIVGFHILSAFLWILGQTFAVFSYDAAASMGLQEPRDLTDPALVQVSIGIGMADTVILIPLHTLAAYAIVRREFYGIIMSWMNFAVSMYWTAIYWTGLIAYGMGSIKHASADTTSLAVTIFVFLFAVWGSWYQCRGCRGLVDWWVNDFAGFRILATVGYKQQALSVGLRVVVCFHLLACTLILLNQTYAIVDYDRVVLWGLQDPVEDQDPALKYWNITLAIANTFVQLPLHAMSICGIIGRDFWGIICSWMAFGATMYWTVIRIASHVSFRWGGVVYAPFIVFDWIYMIAFLCFAVWGSWFECRTKELIIWWKADLKEDGVESSGATETSLLVGMD